MASQSLSGTNQRSTVHLISRQATVQSSLLGSPDVCFQIPVSPSLLDELEATYAPPDHPVFQLVPPAFADRAKVFYANMGDPIVTFSNFWAIYERLLQDFKDHCNLDQDIQLVLTAHDERVRNVHEEDPGQILPGLKELRNVADAVGQLGDTTARDRLEFIEPEYADFTDDELDEGDDGMS